MLPVPALAAPSALSDLLPALMDGRHGQLPASEERWEHAGLLESCTESAALYGDDKYGAAYQAAEEEGETFLRWQEQLDGAQAVAAEQGAGLSEESGGPVELTRYRVLAMRTDEAHPGAATLTNYANARSAEEALAKVRRANERPGGLYGEQGLYRVVEESPDSELRQEEESRRRYLTAILENATATVRGRELEDPDADLVSRLDDFFTRAVVFPDPHTPGVHPRPHQATFGWTSEQPYIEHASDPGRALALFLLAYLDHYGLSLEAAARTRARPEAQPVSEGRPSAREAEGGEAEGGEASAELVERVLDICGQHYTAVTGTSSELWNKELSREMAGMALRTVRLADRKAYPKALQAYLGEDRARLEKLWRVYGPAGVYPRGVYHLIEQPESFVLCERIDNAPMWLQGVWSRECESDTPLERLQEAWLHGTSESDGR